MTPKEKAQELLNNYIQETNRFTGGQESHTNILAKRCAIIAVDEILNGDLLWTPEDSYFIKKTHKKSYWEKVKEELSKL